jgi:hypothetical protein
VTVQVSIAAPEDVDSGFHQPVRSIVFVQADEPVGDITSCYVTDQDRGGTASLGHVPFLIATGVWRIRSEYLLRSVRDVIIGYTRVDAARKSQWFQWDGYDLEYAWGAHGADGSHLSALLQIREAMKMGEGADRASRPRFGFTKD